MKKALLFFSVLLVLVYSNLNRFMPVSLELVQPTTKTVEIKGEVKAPGIYTVKRESTIQDVINEANGLTEYANTDTISLVRVVEDNEVIVIGKINENEIKYVSINTASQEELETLPGIGSTIAGRIIEYRIQNPFQSLEDILNVKGIGEKLFAKIKDRICL